MTGNVGGYVVRLYLVERLPILNSVLGQAILAELFKQGLARGLCLL